MVRHLGITNLAYSPRQGLRDIRRALEFFAENTVTFLRVIISGALWHCCEKANGEGKSRPGCGLPQSSPSVAIRKSRRLSASKVAVPVLKTKGVLGKTFIRFRGPQAPKDKRRSDHSCFRSNFRSNGQACCTRMHFGEAIGAERQSATLHGFPRAITVSTGWPR